MSVPNPATISSKLISIQEQYAPILDDFIKYYVLYKQNPSSNEYTQMFSSIKGNLHKINSQLFTETNTIQTSIKDLNDIMTKMNSEIEEEKNSRNWFAPKVQNRKLKCIIIILLVTGSCFGTIAAKPFLEYLAQILVSDLRHGDLL